MSIHWKTAAHSAYDIFSWYKYLRFFFLFIYLFIYLFHLGFWSGNLILIAPFPDCFLLVPCYVLRLTRKRAFTLSIRYSTTTGVVASLLRVSRQLFLFTPNNHVRFLYAAQETDSFFFCIGDCIWLGVNYISEVMPGRV